MHDAPNGIAAQLGDVSGAEAAAAAKDETEKEEEWESSI